MTFSFLTSIPNYYDPLTDPITGFMQFSELQKQAVRNVLTSIENVAHIGFTEVAGIGDVTLAMNVQSGTSGYAYYPIFGYYYAGDTISSVYPMDISGDVWLNSSQAWTTNDFTVGGTGYGTLVHEMGHALGLKHPFEATLPSGYTLDASLDNTKYTVMAYTPHLHGLYRTVTESSPGHYSWQYEYIQPETLMPLDIEALQYLYGANTSFNSGNDTYTFDLHRPFIKTIWDGGGNDTISVANFTLGCVIDLKDGNYSCIRIPSDALPTGYIENNSGIYDGTDNLAIAFGSIIENVIGGKGNDRLLGNAVANVLNGGTGADTMIGGNGSDTYFVDNNGDVVTESTAIVSTGGTDLVNSYLGSYTLGINIENGRVLATGTANLTGNGLNNILYAGAGNNLLNGNTGSDTASYLYASAAVVVNLTATSAQTTGSSGLDTLLNIENLTGSSYNDKLTGNSDNNVLNGGLGIDILAGGLGNDTYVINVLTDIVTELAGQGTELIQSSISYSLVDTDGAGINGGNVENLQLTGNTAINATGNALNNILYTNAANNILNGGTGLDTASYLYASAAVIVNLTTTSAQLTGSSGSDTLLNIENLTGSSFNDKLTGNSGNNILNGGLGIDNLAGGLGNDSYVINVPTDMVTELIGQGTDLIQSAISYSLVDTDGAGANGGNIENLQLTGNTAINATGNALNNVLYANTANNILNGGTGIDTVSYLFGASAGVTIGLASATSQTTGGSGSDTLLNIENLTGSSYNDKLTGNNGNNAINGGFGADILTGGLSTDRFIFLSINDSGLSNTNRDTITDFSAIEGDRIDISAIDANTSTAINDAFTSLQQGSSFSDSFINSASLYFDQSTKILYANNDSDAQADFSIQLTGLVSASLGYFVL
jgi:Ca2+-binding RTX toxin-like protein